MIDTTKPRVVPKRTKYGHTYCVSMRDEPDRSPLAMAGIRGRQNHSAKMRKRPISLAPIKGASDK